MKLFGYWRSSATYRVRIALALKEIEYEYEPVNLLQGEQFSPEHLKRNPQGLVPALVTESGQTLTQSPLTQSLAIIEYLEEAFPQNPLLPADPVAKAKARAIAATIACEGQPFMNLRIQKYLKARDFDDAAMSQWLNQWPGGAMGAAEKLADETAGDYCVGDTPGMADAFLVPQWFGAKRFGVDVSGFTKLNAIYERCLKHPAFEKAHPDNQPDAQKA